MESAETSEALPCACAAPAAQAHGGLPCLLSTNSDGASVESAGKLGSNDRKRAESTRQNLASFQSVHGLACGVMTVTFAKDISTRDAQRKMANFRRRVLKSEFGHSITVREFTERGRPHFHMLIDCRGDITSGFNWDHYDAGIQWSKKHRDQAKPRGSLNRTARLEFLHDLLFEKAARYGLGRIEIVPVRKPNAIAFYLGGYLSKSLPHKPADAKRTRPVNYSHGCPRVFRGRSMVK
jgi:hypothetical protein